MAVRARVSRGSAEPELEARGVVSQLVGELFACLLCAFVVGASCWVGGSWSERLVGVGDVLFDAVPRDGLRGVVPTVTLPTGVGSFADPMRGLLIAGIDAGTIESDHRRVALLKRSWWMR